MPEYKPCCVNRHCISSDCPNIQCDMCDDKWGYGIAEDIGLSRIKCSECDYRRGDCDDCIIKGTPPCPEAPHINPFINKENKA